MSKSSIRNMAQKVLQATANPEVKRAAEVLIRKSKEYSAGKIAHLIGSDEYLTVRAAYQP